MKLARVGAVGAEKLVVVTDDGYLDASSVVADLGPDTLNGAIDKVRAAFDAGELPAAEVAADARIGAPIARPGKVIAVGKNYVEHARETGSDVPTEPLLFNKDPYGVIGPNDTVLIPRGSDKPDHEVELAVVIGKKARYVDTHEEALACVAGYAIANDVSERTFQRDRGGQWVKGKSFETSCPLGPWLVTPDEVGDPQALRLTLAVDGETRQDGTTADMIFPVAEIIRYTSQFMVLYPGDLIVTGTPAGVAAGHPAPQPWLRPGQTMTLSVEKLGTQNQPVEQG